MRRLALHTAIVLATLAALAIVWQLRGAILIFFLSLATAAALRPRVAYLVERGLPRALALLFTYFALLVSLIGVVLLLAFPLANEAQRVGDDFLHAYEHVTEHWHERSPMQRAIARRLPPPGELLAGLLGGDEATIAETVLGFTFGIVGLIANLLVVVVLSIYWSIDRVHFERLWLSLLPAHLRIEARDLWRSIETEVGAYLRSEAAQSAAAGVLLGVGFALMGLPYPVLLATVGALAWFVPWVGMPIAVLSVGFLSLPTLALAREPAAAITFVMAAAYTLLVLSMLEIFVEPRLFNRRRYNSLLIVVVVISLAEMIGVAGIVLGPPLAAALQIFLAHLFRRRAAAVVSEGIHPETSLRERVAQLGARLDRVENPAPELVSLAERVSRLVDEAENLAPIGAEARGSATG